MSGMQFAHYLAGIFDGEGHIGFSKKHFFRAEIANTNEEIIRLLHERLGFGSVSVLASRKEGWRPKYSLRTRNIGEGRKFLELIKDKVVIKRDQVSKALARVADYDQDRRDLRKRNEAVRKDYLQGMPLLEIARKFGVSKGNIGHIVPERRLEIRRWSSPELEFLRENYLTMKYKEIAQKLGRREDSVARKLSSMGLFKRGR